MSDPIRPLTLTQPLTWLTAGLVLVVPLLRHASWHTFRDVLDVSGWPARESR